MALTPWKPILTQALALGMIALSAGAAAHGAPKYKVLHSFGGADGAVPADGVILDATGNLYGTTKGGGNGNCTEGCGVVFELTPHAEATWSETVLYNFQGGNDGEGPISNLLFDASGDLYGTTQFGGGYGGGYGDGTVFKLTSGSGSWQESILYSFGENSRDGALPAAGLISDGRGNLYGTTWTLGANLGGTAFEFTLDSNGWKETILHSFQTAGYGQNPPGGSNPAAVLIRDRQGNLYGTTYDGGGVRCEQGAGCGVVFELVKHAGRWRERVLHRFYGFNTDGVIPSGGVIRDAAGNLYGTTEVGGGSAGCEGGCGTVYKLTRGSNGKWKEAILYNFGNAEQGAYPGGGVVMDNAGNLYGTAGGPGCGVIYKLSTGPKGKWTYTVLHSFTYYDGCNPGSLTWDGKGNLYGIAALGGGTDNGVVFELTP